jgi:glycosyltransferase involved in cell wall biosynthesis
VIYPPVAQKIDFEPPKMPPSVRTNYLSLGRLVPYKRLDLIIEAFRRMPDRELEVLGDGPERTRLEKSLPKNVKLRGRVSEAEVRRALCSAKALVFAAQEDFGIVLVEAQAAGTPVIAYARGGACETVQDGTRGFSFESKLQMLLSRQLKLLKRSSLSPKVSGIRQIVLLQKCFVPS